MALSKTPRAVSAKEYNDLVADLNNLKTALNALKAEFSEHTHGGVTAGEGNTGPGPTTAVDDVVILTS